MNYSETYFELDSEEATHCHHCHLISCVYIKGLVNTKDQSSACMCENDVEGVKRSLNSFNCYSCYSSWKSLGFLHNTAYRVLLFLLLLMLKGSKDYVMLKQGTNTFLLITFLIFNWFSIRNNFWKADTLSFPVYLFWSWSQNNAFLFHPWRK